MGADPRQFLLLAIALAIPAACFVFGKHRLLLAWVAFTLSVHIFDTNIVTNLPVGRIVGLFYLPAIVFRPRWLRLPPARVWMVNFVYMVILGVIFGFIIPWPDKSGVRSFTQVAQGRSVIFLIRTLSDLSLLVFVMRQLLRSGAFATLGQWMFRGAWTSAAFGVIQVVTHTDYYAVITGAAGPQTLDFRSRGLSFEARGLGLACAYGLVIGLSKPRRKWTDWLGLSTLAAGLVASSSSSGLAAAAVGVILIALLGSFRVRAAMITTLAVVALSVWVLFTYFPRLAERSQSAVGSRIEGRGTLEANVAANTAEEIALRLDVFDASAALFLIRTPLYLMIGTGPGLITLPASDHIPLGIFTAVFGSRIDSPPSHGILLEIANTGMIGLLAWLLQVWMGWRALHALRKHPHLHLPLPPRAAEVLFVTGAALYAVQNSPSPIWAVILAIGWAGVSIRRSLAHAPRVPLPKPSLSTHSAPAGAVPQITS